MTHSTAPVNPTPKPCAIAGRLILTIDESSVAIKIPMATIASTAYFPARSPTSWATEATARTFSTSGVTPFTVSSVSFDVSCCFIGSSHSPDSCFLTYLLLLSNILTDMTSKCFVLSSSFLYHGFCDLPATLFLPQQLYER